jgi:hypothetical protein
VPRGARHRDSRPCSLFGYQFVQAGRDEWRCRGRRISPADSDAFRWVIKDALLLDVVRAPVSENGCEDEHDLMVSVAIEVEQILQHAEQVQFAQLLFKLFLNLATCRIGGVFAEFDMASERPLIDIAEGIRVGRNEVGAISGPTNKNHGLHDMTSLNHDVEVTARAPAARSRSKVPVPDGSGQSAMPTCC